MNSCFLDQQHFYPDQPSSLSHLIQCLMKLVLSLNSLPQDLLGLELTLFSSCLMNFCHLIRHLMTSNYLKSFSMNPQHLNSFCCFRYLKCLIAYYLSPSYYCLRFLKYLIVYRLKPCLMNFQYLSSFGYCCLMTSIDCLHCLKSCVMSFQHLSSSYYLMTSFGCLYYLKYLIACCLKLYLMSFQRLSSFDYCLMTSIDCLRYLKHLIACCLKSCLMSFQCLNSSYCLCCLKYLIACCSKSYLMSFQHLSSSYYLMTSIGCLNYLKYLSSFGYYLMKPYLNLIFRLMSSLHLNSLYYCSMILDCFYSMMMSVKNWFHSMLLELCQLLVAHL